MTSLSRLLTPLLLVVAAACGSSGEEEDPVAAPEGPPPIPNKGPIVQPTSLTCPTGTTLSYENFGETFLRRYCTSCHSQHVPGDKRAGAPAGADFDTPEAVLLWRAPIIARATGEAATMPPGFKASASDQAALAEWLGCGAP